jgi:hypothetical protein
MASKVLEDEERTPIWCNPLSSSSALYGVVAALAERGVNIDKTKVKTTENCWVAQPLLISFSTLL